MDNSDAARWPVHHATPIRSQDAHCPATEYVATLFKTLLESPSAVQQSAPKAKHQASALVLDPAVPYTPRQPVALQMSCK
ncbi:hypothetical protein V3481_018948 [Fusarium oxysporum f. sp. vasinfectum]